MWDTLFQAAGQGVAQASPVTVVVNTLLAFALSTLVAVVYKRTHRGLSYSQSFVVSLVLLGTLLCVIMMVVGSNVARAFTLFGAFTLIRFRTAVKDTKDVSFILWALSIGLAIGTGNYMIAAIATVIVGAIVFTLFWTNFGSMRKQDHMLAFVLDTAQGTMDGYKATFDKYVKTANMLNVITREEGKRMEYTFDIQLINAKQSDEFIRDLRGVTGIDHINFIPSKGDIEY